MAGSPPPPANPVRLERWQATAGRLGGVGTSSTSSAAGESLQCSHTLHQCSLGSGVKLCAVWALVPVRGCLVALHDSY